MQDSTDAHPEVPELRLTTPGISYDLDSAEKLVGSMATSSALIAALRADRAINTTGNAELIHNGYFASPDIELYASMVALTRPSSIIEVGAGFSTRAASLAIQASGLHTKHLVVDPEPRTDLPGEVEFIEDRIEAVPPARLMGELDAQSIFFIDSSHIAASGGDVEYIYLSLIPSLPSGCLVHVDDIYLPYTYPAVARERVWTEQPVLGALLSDSERYQTVLPVHLLCRDRPAVVQGLLGPEVGEDPFHMGSSYWFTVS